MPLGRRLHLLALALLVLALTACGGVTQNVRAYRAYAHEEPNIKVQIDRVEDLAVTLQLVDRILVGTSYTPGDPWPRRLAMTDPEFREIKAELRDRYPYKALDDVEVPILKCYRQHIEKALSEYGPTPDKAKYPSLLDALGALNPRTAQIKAHWVAHREATNKLAEAIEDEARVTKEISSLNAEQQKARAGEIAAARSRTAAANGEALRTADDVSRDSQNLMSDAGLVQGEKETIARDTFHALSVAFRIELEALALIPIIVIQAVRSLPTAPRDLTYKTHLKIVRQIWQMPNYVSGIKQSFTKQAALLDAMTSQLAKAFNTSVEKSPGFALRESVVDQIVGITLDSFRIDLRGSADAFVYSAVGTSDRTSNGDLRYDYRGRQFKLDYRIQPIILAGARLDIVLDWIRMPGAANLGFGYSTDRVWKSGGSVESNSLTSQLGIDGVASDVIDAGLGLLGVRSSVKVANFTAGELRQVRALDVNTAVATAPLRLKYTQVDVGYDVLWLMGEDSARAYMEELVIGGRYTGYTLPRIVYEVKNTEPNLFAFSRESPPQPITSRFYMASVQARFGVGDGPRWSPYLDLGIAGGAGPMSYYFLRDPSLPDTGANRDVVREAAWGVMPSAGLGLRWRLFPRGWRVRMELRAYYRVDMIWTKFQHTDSQAGPATESDIGALDFFHSPSIALRGSL